MKNKDEIVEEIIRLSREILDGSSGTFQKMMELKGKRMGLKWVLADEQNYLKKRMEELGYADDGENRQEAKAQ